MTVLLIEIDLLTSARSDIYRNGLRRKGATPAGVEYWHEDIFL